MVTIKVKENTEQAKAFIALAKTLPFVEINEPKNFPTMDEIVEECRISRKKIARSYNVEK